MSSYQLVESWNWLVNGSVPIPHLALEERRQENLATVSLL